MSRRTECELVLGGMWSLGHGPDQAPFPASRRPYSFPSPPPHHSMAANSFPLSRCEQVLGGLQPNTPLPTQRASAGWRLWSKGKQVLGGSAATAGWYWVAVGSRRPAVTAAVAQTMLLSSPLRMAAVTALRGKPAATVAFQSRFWRGSIA